MKKILQCILLTKIEAKRTSNHSIFSLILYSSITVFKKCVGKDYREQNTCAWMNHVFMTCGVSGYPVLRRALHLV